MGSVKTAGLFRPKKSLPLHSFKRPAQKTMAKTQKSDGLTLDEISGYYLLFALSPMRSPLRRISSSLVPARFACAMGVAGSYLASSYAADIVVPLPQVLGEANLQIKASKLGDAAVLLVLLR